MNKSQKLAKRTWYGPYFTWLTNEQKSELDDVVDAVDSEDKNLRLKVISITSISLLPIFDTAIVT